MQSFNFCVPTEVAFGLNAVDKTVELVKQYGGKRVMLVYGSERVVDNGLIPKLKALFAKAHIPCYAFGGTKPNPLVSHAEEGMRQAIHFEADFILALGGGSVIDTAKAIALGAANPTEQLWSMWTGASAFTSVLPLAAIVTIPAAGSEMGNLAVLTHEELHAKRVFGAPGFRPRFAVMDPLLCSTLPTYQIACGVADIFMHTLERYFSPVLGNALTDEIAEGLLRTAIRFGLVAVNNPEDYDAMSEIMWCSSLSNCDLTGVGGIPDFATHELGHELTAQYGVAHGASVAIIWGAWARHCLSTNPARFAQYARKVWSINESDDEKAALAGICATEDYFIALGVPTSFVDCKELANVDDAGINALTDGCLHGDERTTVGAFQPLTRTDIIQIYTAAKR